MFTGIINANGKLINRSINNGDQTLTIYSDDLDFSSINLGDSIAVNGVCLTATSINKNSFTADISKETINKTTIGKLPINQKLNLEPALTLKTPLGGHLVSGHIDGIAQLIDKKSDARSIHFVFAYPKSLQKYLALKGSITIDGVSLTVNGLDDANSHFQITVVPHTISKTILASYQINNLVNLEIDLIARYLERLLKNQQNEISINRLKELGF